MKVMGTVHKILFELIHRTGVLHLKRRWKPRSSVCVLGYHQIETPPFLKSLMGWTMTPGHFRKQIEFLKKNTTILTPAELEGIVVQGWRPPENAVAITFDDGYADVFTIALPILKDLDVPATVFVSTGAVDKAHSIWTNRVYYYFSKTKKTHVSLQLPDGSITGAKWANPLQLKRGILHVMAGIKQQPADELPKILSVLASALGVNRGLDPYPEMPMLTWDQIRDLHASGVVTIGAHTVDHPILSKCSTERQRYEIQESKQRIEAEIQAPCNFMAYPNGQMGDIDRDTMDIVQETGYKAAWMFNPMVQYPDSVQFNAPRNPILVSGLAEFAWNLK